MYTLYTVLTLYTSKNKHTIGDMKWKQNLSESVY